jgi:hypothetical protein
VIGPPIALQPFGERPKVLVCEHGENRDMTSGPETPSTDPEELAAVILDSTRPLAERLAAIDALVDRPSEAAKQAMLRLSERTTEPREILHAAGTGLARMEHSGVRVSNFDMRDMSEVAYLAWDEWRPSE